MQMLVQRVVSPTGGRMGLVMDDIATVRKHFPMCSNGGAPNWAVTGGGATMLLLEATKVHDRMPLCRPIEDLRPHKDLDISVLNAARSRISFVHPHEIFYTRYGSRPKRCDYGTASVDLSVFYIEFLAGCHFGAPPPEPCDVVKVVAEGQAINVTSPEYEIATRFFGPSAPRPDDLHDLALLRSRYSVDLERVAAIVAKTPFRFIDAATVKWFAHANSPGALEAHMRDEALRRTQGIEDANWISESPRSLLLFAPDELPKTLFAQTRPLARAMLTECGLENVNSDQLTVLLASGVRAFPKTLQTMNSSYEDFVKNKVSLQFCVRSLRVLMDIQRALLAHGCNKEFDMLADAYIARLIMTPYVHVFYERLALLSQCLKERLPRYAVVNAVYDTRGFFVAPSLARGRSK